MTGHDTMVEALISDERVEIDGEDSYGSTPTLLAARHNRTLVTMRLLGTGRVDPNSPDHLGRTPLWYAKRYANPDIVKLLLQHARNSDIASEREVFPTPGMGTMRNDNMLSQCDACTLFIHRGYRYYSCDICNEGDFNLCSDCHGLGVRCLGVGHQMTMECLSKV